MLNVRVTTVDSKLEFSIPKNSPGKHLFDQIVKTLGIREIWYFGIQYVDKDGSRNWLKLDKKVTSHDLAKEKPPNFFFLVKYYPEDVVEELIEDITREYFYTQVKASILDSKVYCPAETAVLLSSYACQVRLGDYEHLKVDRIPAVEQLLPVTVLDKHQLTPVEWKERIVHCYKQHVNTTREDAILEYLKICQDLEMYGFEYFPIKNKKGTQLWLGIDSMGLNIFEKDDKLAPKIGFPWDEVRNISYKSKKFILKPTDKGAKEWHFFVDRVRYNKQILALSIGNHELYMRRRKCDSIELQQMKCKAQEIREAKAAERQKLMEERLAKEEVQRRLTEMEAAARRTQIQYDEAVRKAEEYSRETERVKDELDKERRAKLDLESTQEELRRMNIKLEQDAASTAEEREMLRQEKLRLEDKMHEQVNLLEQTKQENIERAAQLEEMRKQNEATMAATNNNNHIQEDGDEEGEANSVCQEIDPEIVGLVSVCEGRELEVIDGAKRVEEDRVTELSRNQDLQAQMRQLREDLSSKRNEDRLNSDDRRYEELRKGGFDKFKTLRQIRQGNTKKRVDQFESM